MEKTSQVLVNNKLLEDSIQSFSTIINNLNEIEKNIQSILEDIFPNDIGLEDIERLYGKKTIRKHNVFPDALIGLKEELENSCLNITILKKK